MRDVPRNRSPKKRSVHGKFVYGFFIFNDSHFPASGIVSRLFSRSVCGRPPCTARRVFVFFLDFSLGRINHQGNQRPRMRPCFWKLLPADWEQRHPVPTTNFLSQAISDARAAKLVPNEQSTESPGFSKLLIEKSEISVMIVNEHRIHYQLESCWFIRVSKVGTSCSVTEMVNSLFVDGCCWEKIQLLVELATSRSKDYRMKGI